MSTTPGFGPADLPLVIQESSRGASVLEPTLDQKPGVTVVVNSTTWPDREEARARDEDEMSLSEAAEWAAEEAERNAMWAAEDNAVAAQAEAERVAIVERPAREAAQRAQEQVEWNVEVAHREATWAAEDAAQVRAGTEAEGDAYREQLARERGTYGETERERMDRETREYWAASDELAGLEAAEPGPDQHRACSEAEMTASIARMNAAIATADAVPHEPPHADNHSRTATSTSEEVDGL